MRQRRSPIDSMNDRRAPSRAGRRDRPLQIGLMWHSLHSGNLGLQALTHANIALVDEVAAALGIAVSYTVFAGGSLNQVHLAGEPPVVRLTTAAIISPWRLWRHLRRLDCVLDIGEGDGFTDIYGPKRLARQVLTKIVTRSARRPLMLSPQTIGPFSTAPARFAAGWVLRGAQMIVVRDDLSARQVRRLIEGGDPISAIDVAFAASPPPTHPKTPGRLNIALNVSGLLYTNAGDFKSSGLGYNYKEFIQLLITYLTSRTEFVVHIIVHVTGDPGNTDSDEFVSDDLVRTHPDIKRIPNFGSPEEARLFLSQMDVLVSSRMHACIAAYSIGIPIIPVSYSVKFSGTFDTLNYPWYIPSKGVSTEAAIAFVCQALADLPALSRSIADGQDIVSERIELYRGALRSFLGLAYRQRIGALSMDV